MFSLRFTDNKTTSRAGYVAQWWSTWLAHAKILSLALQNKIKTKKLNVLLSFERDEAEFFLTIKVPFIGLLLH